MQEKKEFLSPRLTGKRYESHTLPLDVLEDISAYEDLLTEVAKWLYLQDNPGRKRVPKGFNEGLSLHLSGVEDGSAIPTILLVASMAGLFPKEGRYFEKARDVIAQTIASVDDEIPSQIVIPDHLLKKFNRIGKNLQEDETIEFQPHGHNKAILNKQVRKRLILASGERFIQNPITIRAVVKELNKERKSCTVGFRHGQSLEIPLIPDQYYKTVLTAFDRFEEKQKILIKGIGRFNRNDVLESLDTIESIVALEPLDVVSRLEEISELREGWYNGIGKGFSFKDLSSFESHFDEEFDTSLPLPYIYPTVDGKLQLEWNTPTDIISLEISLQNLKSEYFHHHKQTDTIVENELDLSSSASWAMLNENLLRIFSVNS